MNSDGEADDGLTVDRYYAASVAPLFVARSFDAAFHAKRIQLSLYCFDEGFCFSELFDCYHSRVEGRRGLERARDGKAEANLVTADVQSFSCEWQHVAVMIGGNPK